MTSSTSFQTIIMTESASQRDNKRSNKSRTGKADFPGLFIEDSPKCKSKRKAVKK